MGRRSARWHDNGALVWTWPLTLAVSGAGLGLYGIAALMWATRSPEQVARGDAGFMGPALFGTVALIVAVSGRIYSAQILRYQDLTFPAVPAPSPAIQHLPVRARTVRRRSGLPYLYLVIAVGGLLLAVAANWDSQPYAVSGCELALAAACLAGCFLLGPAARFVVTPGHLHIATAWHRISVPRHLLAGFSRSGVDVRLHLTNGDHIYFRVDSPLLDVGCGQYRTNGRAQLRTVHRIVNLLRDIPADPDLEATVATTSRPVMIGIVITAGVLAVSAVVGLALAR
jgi:hypothetical protein